MSCYIVSYDLRKERDYKSLIEAIKKYKWAHVLESTWAIVTTQSATEVRDYLAQHIDDDDGLFVLKSGVEAAWRKVLCPNEWLKENI